MAPSKQIYRPEIDGLRAIAVLAVVFYHAGLPGFRGGFVGVDIFFVISGYLITRIIRRESERNTFSLRRFYEHRTRRILPALAAMLIVSAITATITLLPEDLEQFSQSLITTALFASNIFFWRSLNYFSQPAELIPLLHTWSLAIEEQFYILFPPLMMLLLRRSLNAARVAAVLAMLGSLGLAFLTTGHAPVAAFFLTPVRGWELCLGALLALDAIPPIENGPSRQVFAFAAIAILFAVIACLTPQSPFPWPWGLLPTLATALFMHANGQHSTWAGSVLSRPPVVGVGLISYSLYLWHWPLFAFLRYTIGPLYGLETVGALIASLLMAVLSWRFIEHPFRGPGARFTRAKMFVLGAATITLLAFFGAIGVCTSGLPERFPQRIAAMSSFTHTDTAALYRAGSCLLRTSQSASDFPAQTCFAPRGASAILLWGDSHAAHLWPGLTRIPRGDVLEATSTGCPPVLDQRVPTVPNCESFNRRVKSLIESHQIRVAILSAHWLLDQASPQALARTLDWLYARRIPVILVGPNVEFDTPLPILLARRMIYAPNTTSAMEPAIPAAFARDARMQALYAQRPGVTYVSILERLCHKAMCPTLLTGDVPLNWDGSHLTKQGSQLVVEKALLPALSPYIRQ